ncbi:MAG: hypothetical protein Q7R47_01195, partial [Candidatus Diapherotrites archaeon]|nr:hypothetical protein [Candidatus Diapherotrites archaeon]
MNSTRALLGTSVLLIAAVGPWLPLKAQNVPHLTTTHPGGMPGLPVVTGIQKVTNGLQVTWDGPSGYYQLFQK